MPRRSFTSHFFAAIVACGLPGLLVPSLVPFAISLCLTGGILLVVMGAYTDSWYHGDEMGWGCGLILGALVVGAPRLAVMGWAG